jgi:hypothetical protein
MVLVVFGVFPSSRVLSAPSVTLAWDASSDPSVTGYNLYYGGGSRNYTNTVNTGGATSAGISNLVVGATYYFAATCYNAAGLESDYSAEVAYTVPAGNTNVPPTLDPILDLVINENAGVQTVNLTGITPGSGSGVGNLTITASSSNPGLIPTPSVAYTSPNSTGSLSFAPALFGFGAASIIVTVNNGGVSNNSVSRSFTVTVNAVNQPPTLNPIPNLTINENAGQQSVNLSGISSGAPNEIQTLAISAFSSNLKLIPNPTVAYTSPNPTGSLTFTPVTNAFGNATVTVMVDDGGATSNTIIRSFTVTVNQTQTNSPATNSTPTSWTLYFQSSGGQVATWYMNGTNRLDGAYIGSGIQSNWKIMALGDFSGGGSTDIVWESTAGLGAVWFMAGTNHLSGGYFSPQVDPSWTIVGTGDFNGDGKTDLLWQHTGGSVAVWFMDSTNRLGGAYISQQIESSWHVVGTGDFNGDGQTDLLFEHQTDGTLAVWFMNGTNRTSGAYLNAPKVASNWRVVGTGDFNGDGQTDILWQSTDGWLAVWYMNGTNRIGGGWLNPGWVEPAWRAVGLR